MQITLNLTSHVGFSYVLESATVHMIKLQSSRIIKTTLDALAAQMCMCFGLKPRSVSIMSLVVSFIVGIFSHARSVA